jgi:geranylgeranyl diphosphate synthase type II
MVGGQYIDVRNSCPTGAATLRRLHELKTGRLIGASVECVLLLTGGQTTTTTLTDFRAFAAELGVLFQIVDDILDVTGNGRRAGQAARRDERHGKLTYVSQYGLDGRRELAQRVAPQRPTRSPRPRRTGRRARADHRLHLHPPS